MDFQLSSDQTALLKMVKDVVAQEIIPYAREMDEKSEMRPELIQILHDAGLLNLVVPEEYDGAELDALTIALIYEELARGDAGIATAVAANSLAAYPVLINGTEEQKKHFFGFLNAGKLAAFALTEPSAGSDAGGVATAAVKDGDDYVLTGTKCFITNGGLADVFVIFANTRKSAGVRGLTAFIVDKDTPGFSIGKHEDKMGIRSSSTCELILDQVRVPAWRRLGREGHGFRIAMKTLDASRPFVGAVSVGLSQAALDFAVKYARERQQFGKAIASFQMVQGMIADMAMLLEGARLMVYKACWMKDQGLPFSKEAAMAKCYAGDAAMKITTDALQVVGGYGYSKEYPVERYMRDAKIMQIYEGTNQIQRLVVANQILY